MKLLFWPLGAPAAMGAITAGHLLVLALGMWWLARRTLALAPPAGLVAAVVMVGSGTTMVQSVRFEQIAVVAWIPWLLAALDALVAAPAGRRTRPVAAGAAVTAMMLLAGHPNQVLIGAALAAAWTAARRHAVRVCQGARDVHAGRRERRRPGLAPVAASVGLGVGVAALPLVLAGPLYRHLALSPATMLDEAGQDRYTLIPSRLVAAFLGDGSPATTAGDVPTLETPVFVGAAALVLAAAGAAVWCRRVGERDDRATAWALVAVAVVGVLLALGPAFGFYRLVASLPGLGNARVPLRWLFLTTFAVAVLAAAGVSSLMARGLGDGPRRRALLWAMGIAAAVVAAGAVAPPWGDGAPAAGARMGWLAVLVVVGAAGAAFARPAGGGHAGAGVVLAAAVALELGVSAAGGYPRSLRTDRSFADRATSVDEFLAGQGARALEVGAGPPAPGSPKVNANLTAGWRSLDGYDGGLWISEPYVAAAEQLTGGSFWAVQRLGEQVSMPLDSPTLARFGVRYVVVGAGVDRRTVEGWSGPVAGDGHREVWENPSYTGEAHWWPERSGPPVNGQRPEPGAIDVSTGPTSGGGILVVAEQALPGWSVTVDGRPAPLVDAGGFGLAADVAPGAHEVRFRYRPPGFVAGAAVSLLCLAATLAAAVTGQRPKRRRGSRSSGSTGRAGTTTT